MTKRTIEQAKKYADGLIRERDLVRKELVKCNSEYCNPTQRSCCSLFSDAFNFSQNFLRLLENFSELCLNSEKN